jgi:putative ATP-dependent endonuclease of the OLD family
LKRDFFDSFNGANECGATRAAEKLRRGLQAISNGEVSNEVERNLLADLRSTVLNTAKRFGKARFAQKASKYVDLAEEIPAYIRDAINWLIADEPN